MDSPLALSAVSNKRFTHVIEGLAKKVGKAKLEPEVRGRDEALVAEGARWWEVRGH